MEELKSLINRVQAGELEAYGAIVQRFQDMAVGYAYSILGDFHLAEDAAQEAFIEAYPNLSKVYGPTAFPSWFRKIIFKHCDRLTRGKYVQMVPLEEAIDLPSKAKDPAVAAEEEEMKNMVITAIASLPENQRTVTTLFYINGYSQNQIADFLEVPATTVDHRLRASRKRLKSTLSPNLIEERIITMTKDTLHEEAPSRDDSFANAVGICNAAQAGNLKRVQEILAVKPELAKQDLAGNNEHQPIHFAAEEGHAEIVHTLLEAGADPLKGVYPHREATSALAIATDRGHTAVVEAIEKWLNRKRGTTSQGEEFTTAASRGDDEHIRSMLDADPSLINATDKVGQTALFKVIHRGDLPLLVELLDRGAEVDHLDANGHRPLHHCLHHSWKVPDAKYKTYAIMAGILIARGAEYNMWVACGVGDVNGVRRMIDSCEDKTGLSRSNAPERNDHRNPFIVACFQGHVEVVRLLLDNGVDPDAPFEIDVAGETVKQWGRPLWIAANRGHYAVAELLLERGANPNTAVYASGSAVSGPQLQGNTRLADLLFRYGATDDLLSYCVTNNVPAIMEKIQNNSEDRARVLWSAILAGNVDMVAFGLRDNPQLDDGEWFNLLEQAVRGWRLGDLKINNDNFDRRNYATILSMLLDHGVNPSLRHPRDPRFDFTFQ